jgi:fructosamine-3-kinase
MNSLTAASERLLSGVVASTQTLHGGDLSDVALIVLQDGRRAVIKSGPAPRTEAAMLSALTAAGVKAPTVLGVDNETLALEPIAAGGRLDRAWQDLGMQLARLHQATGPAYGWPENYAFGPVVIENAWADTWPAFYAQRRLLTHIPFLAADLARRVEALARDMDNRLPRGPPAALLHGDLWGGNVLVAGDKVAAFIDPACFYGHAEIDLAMLGLFDRPGPAFFDAYGGPAPGYPDRCVIYRLWPAMVHLRLFGEGYRAMVERLLHQAGV